MSVAMDGAAPELNPGRVHQRINTNSEARHAQCDQLFTCISIKAVKLEL
ncbi:MAG TPA: hypothetical protein GX719_07285 [Gammaproteobacteria bacterium]|nr:hypothetical protein [Gammaproteobacteria bacterium]